MCRGQELSLPDGAHQPPAAAAAAGRGAADQGVILLWIQRGSVSSVTKCLKTKIPNRLTGGIKTGTIII